jgi:hypothetical protein
MLIVRTLPRPRIVVASALAAGQLVERRQRAIASSLAVDKDYSLAVENLFKKILFSSASLVFRVLLLSASENEPSRRRP